MTIYTRGGAEVKFIEAWTKWGERGCFLVRAKLLSAYPDGSGANSIGKILFDDAKCEGWASINDFRATDGIRELYDVANTTPSVQPPDDLIPYLYHHYWPHMFDKKGRPIYNKKAA
jgi:hypothetical protein